EGERIGMSVGGDAAIAEGTGIRDQTDLVARLEVAAEDVIAAARESPAERRTRARLLDPAKQLRGPRSEQPARLVVQLPGFRLEIAAAEQNRPTREQRPIGREVGALRQSGYRAVVGALQQRLALENLLRHPPPVPHPGPARPCQARDVEPRRLADEMIVGRGVAREVSVYETCVLVDGIEPEPPELRPAAAGEER